MHLILSCKTSSNTHTFKNKSIIYIILILGLSTFDIEELLIWSSFVSFLEKKQQTPAILVFSAPFSLSNCKSQYDTKIYLFCLVFLLWSSIVTDQIFAFEMASAVALIIPLLLQRRLMIFHEWHTMSIVCHWEDWSNSVLSITQRGSSREIQHLKWVFSTLKTKNSHFFYTFFQSQVEK